MKLIELIYTSVAAPDLDEAEVLEILKKSQEKNLARKISGLLCLQDRRFTQLIAGNESDIMDLLGHISRDTRHGEISIIYRGETDRASMPTWAMAYYSPTVPEASRRECAFVLEKEDVRRLCEALPEAIGGTFLALLGSCPSLKADSTTGAIPVVFLSSDESLETRQAALGERLEAMIS